MDHKAFSDGAILKLGWKKTQEHLGFLIGVTLLSFFIILVPQVVSIFVKNDIVSILLFIVYMFLAIFLAIGLLRIVIAIADDKQPEFGLLFSGMDVFLNYLFVTILYSIIVFAGFILLIFPGVIWMLKFMFAPWLVVDQKMGPIEALKKSAEMTSGMKWDLLGFQAVAFVVSMLGVLALYIGMLVTTPLVMIATAALYRHLGPKHGK